LRKIGSTRAPDVKRHGATAGETSCDRPCSPGAKKNTKSQGLIMAFSPKDARARV
jgi:hypothetical protein